METATSIIRKNNSTTPLRQALWMDFYRALAQRNFIRAANLAHRLCIDEERIRRIRRDALREFIAEYRNFDGAARLCADYGVTTEEFCALIEEILKRKELEAERTFTFRPGRPAHLSGAEQIRSFARRWLELLRRRKRQRSIVAWWKRLISALKSLPGRMSDPWQGGFPHGGLAYG